MTSPQTPTGDCPVEQVELLAQGPADQPVPEELCHHLEQCADCRARLEGAAAPEIDWARVRRALKEQPAPVEGDEGRGGLSFSLLRLLGPSDDPSVVGKIGPFEVTEVIGSGGMGMVLKARDPALDRHVAIKILAPHLASSATARRRFAREARAAAAVIHDHVIAIYQVSEHHELPYLVMPYLPDPSLQQRLDRDGKLDLESALSIGLQVAGGLEAAHAQGLIHRDVKPANVLLAKGTERAIITDFGLARAADDASLTSSGVLAGTPHYMSPEQARGELVDFRSDLFSLGSLLFAMLAGQPPVNRELGSETIRVIGTEPMPRLRTVVADAPEWVERLVSWLHQPLAEDRPESARQVAETLEQCLKHVRNPQAEGLPERLTRAEETEMGHPNDKRLFSLIALGLFLAVFLTPPLLALTTRDEWALAFGGVAACLALFFGCLSWAERISRVVVKTLGGAAVLAGLFFLVFFGIWTLRNSGNEVWLRELAEQERAKAERLAAELGEQGKGSKEKKAGPAAEGSSGVDGIPPGGPPGGMAGPPGSGMPGMGGPLLPPLPVTKAKQVWGFLRVDSKKPQSEVAEVIAGLGKIGIECTVVVSPTQYMVLDLLFPEKSTKEEAIEIKSKILQFLPKANDLVVHFVGKGTGLLTESIDADRRKFSIVPNDFLEPIWPNKVDGNNLVKPDRSQEKPKDGAKESGNPKENPPGKVPEPEKGGMGGGMPGGSGMPSMRMGGPPGMGGALGGDAGADRRNFAEELKIALGEEVPVPEWKKPKYTPVPQLSGTWVATKAYLNGEEFKSQGKGQGIAMVCYGESILIRMGRNFNQPELELGSGQIRLVPGEKGKTFMVRGSSSKPDAIRYNQGPIFCTYQLNGEKLSIAFSESEPKLGPAKGQDYYEFKAFSKRFPEEVDVTQPVSGKKFFCSSVDWVTFLLLKGVWFCESAQFRREASLSYSKLDPKRFVLTCDGNGFIIYFQTPSQSTGDRAANNPKIRFPATTWCFHAWSPGEKGPIEARKIPDSGKSGTEFLNYEYKGDQLQLTVADSIEGLGRAEKHDVFVFKKVTENWFEEEWQGEKLAKKVEIHAQKGEPMGPSDMSQEKPKDGAKESGKPKETPPGKVPEKTVDGKEKGM